MELEVAVAEEEGANGFSDGVTGLVPNKPAVDDLFPKTDDDPVPELVVVKVEPCVPNKVLPPDLALLPNRLEELVLELPNRGCPPKTFGMETLLNVAAFVDVWFDKPPNEGVPKLLGLGAPNNEDEPCLGEAV